MLESEIKKLTAAVEANTAALLSGAAPVAVPAAVVASALGASAAIPPAAETEAKPAAVVEIELPPDVPATVAAPVADIKAITEGIVALCKAKGREAAAQLMAEYGAQKVPDLKKVSEKYPEILAKINAAIEAK